jgi:hypothetical protein
MWSLEKASLLWLEQEGQFWWAVGEEKSNSQSLNPCVHCLSGFD